jgi:hypothetical protein
MPQRLSKMQVSIYLRGELCTRREINTKTNTFIFLFFSLYIGGTKRKLTGKC